MEALGDVLRPSMLGPSSGSEEQTHDTSSRYASAGSAGQKGSVSQHQTPPLPQQR